MTGLMRRPVVVVVVLIHLQMVTLRVWLMVLMASRMNIGQPMNAPTSVRAPHESVQIVLLSMNMLTSGKSCRMGMRVMQVIRFASC